MWLVEAQVDRSDPGEQNIHLPGMDVNFYGPGWLWKRKSHSTIYHGRAKFMTDPIIILAPFKKCRDGGVRRVSSELWLFLGLLIEVSNFWFFRNFLTSKISKNFIKHFFTIFKMLKLKKTCIILKKCVTCKEK